MNRNPGSDTVQDEDQTSFDPISRNGKPWGLFESFAGCAHEPLPVTLTISDKQRPLKDSKQKTQKQPKKKGPPASSTARVKRISSLYFGLSMAKEHEGSSSQRTRGLSSSSKQPTITASRTAPPSSTQRGASLGQIVCHSKQDPDEQEALLLAKQQFEILRRPIAPPLTSYLNPYHYFEEGPDASEASDQEPLSSASHSSLSSPSSLRAIDSAAATDAYGLKTTDTNTAYVLVTSSSCSSSLSLSLSPSVSTPIGPSLTASELCLPPSDGPAHKVRSRLASEVGMLDLEDTGDDGGDGDSQSHEGDDDCNDRDEDGSGDDGDPRGDGAEQQGQRSPLIFSASPPRGYDAPEGISLTLPPGLSPVPDPSPEAATEGGYDLLEEIDSLAMVRKGDQADNALWRAGDWNHRFQELITMIQRSTITDLHRPRLYQELLTLSHDFINTAKIYGRIIISERFLPVRPLSETETGTGKGCLAQYKTINPIIMGGVCGGEKYIVSNILFKFAVDQHRILGSDHAAAKVAGHELVGHTAYFNLCLPGLHLPLMALVDYMGFRLTAMSLLPVTRQTLVYGSANGGQTVFATLPGYNALMAQAGRRLALAPHLCGMDEEHSVSLWAAADIEGHLGTDGRFYLLDLSRTMPPMDMRLSPDHPQAFLYRHLRPELVASFSHEVEGRALCPDTYSGFIRHDPKFNEYIEDVRDATKFLLENVIPNTAKELKWVVLEAISQKRVETVNCSEILRRSGVNLRLMGHVLRLSDQPVVRMLILVEVVARVLKNELRHLLRRKMQAVKLTLVEPYRDLVVGFLNHVFYNVQSRSASSVHYWDHILVAECRRAFHVQSFALSDQDEAAISFDPDAGPLEPPVPK
ncbi:MAG: hypothetical protein Q8P67_15165, partial [archaeon]|nr:hypothetical protein [archaeon]